MSKLRVDELESLGTARVIDIDDISSIADLADVADASNGGGLVGVKRSALASAITNVNVFFSSLSVNVWEFAALVVTKPVPADPNTWDWTPAVQAAIDSIADRLDSSTGFDTPVATKGGWVYFPRGNYPVTKVNFRSYVGIKGEEHYNTWFVPFAGATGYLFESFVPLTDRPKGVSLHSFSIGMANRNASTLEGSRPVVNGLNIEGFEKQCSIRDVKIYNIDGVALKTGDTQDMEVENVDIRFVTTPFILDSKEVVDSGGIFNYTNAMKFIACRFENSGASQILQHRSTHFIACKFEKAAVEVDTPHGLDFIGCDWALDTVTYALTVTGVVADNRGMKIVGGSTDCGTAFSGKFITSTTPVHCADVSFRNHDAAGINGSVSTNTCTFSECSKPFHTNAAATSFMKDCDAFSVEGGTGLNLSIERDAAASFEVPTSVVPLSPVAGQWYDNYLGREIEVILRLPYNPGTGAATFEAKKTHDAGVSEYTLGQVIKSAIAGGTASQDLLVFTVLPGESFNVAWSGAGASAVTATAFYR
ncbi:Pectate lyase superfamily protein [compost metagenome]